MRDASERRPAAFRPKRPLRFEVMEAITGRSPYRHIAWLSWKSEEERTFERYREAWPCGLSVDLSTRIEGSRWFGSCGAMEPLESPLLNELCEMFQARGLISSVASSDRRFVARCVTCGGRGVLPSTSACPDCRVNFWARRVGSRRHRGTGYGDGAELPESINDLAHWTAFGEPSIVRAEAMAKEIGHRLLRYGGRPGTEITVSWMGVERHSWRPTYWRARVNDEGVMMPDIVQRSEPCDLRFRPIGDVTALAARQFRFAADRTDENGTDILAPLSELHDLGFALQDAQMFPALEGDGFSASLRWEANVVIAFPVTT